MTRKKNNDNPQVVVKDIGKPVITEVDNRRYVTAYDGRRYELVPRQDGCTGCCFFHGAGRCSRPEHGLQDVSCVDSGPCCIIFRHADEEPQLNDASPKAMPKLTAEDEDALTWVASLGFQIDTLPGTGRVRFRKRLFLLDNDVSMDLVLYRDAPGWTYDAWQACVEIWSSGHNVLNKEWGHPIANVEDLALMMDSLSEDFKEAARC